MGALTSLTVLSGIALATIGLSYFAERPKYAFEQEVAAGLRHAPWTRLVGSMKSADPMSPVSLIWATTTTWRISQPALGDGTQMLRFQSAVIVFPGATSIYMLDVDCHAKRIHAAHTDQPETAEAMRNVLGEPLRDGRGSIFRYIKSKEPWPIDELAQYCDTDWTKERRALPSSHS
jgi:hypothetical protein